MKFLKYLFAIVAVLALLFIGRGILTPSVNYDSEVITINKPVKEAWAVMNDPTNLPKWIKGFKRTELVSGTANTVGAVSHNYIEENGEEMMMTETITAIKPHEYLAMHFSMDMMEIDYEVFFKEKNGKTSMHSTSKTVGNGLLTKSLFSFMSTAMKTQEDENLNNLKKIIEENTKNYFPKPVVEIMEEAEKG